MVNHILIFQAGQKKTTAVNPKNYDGRCFQFAATITLNHEKTDPEKVSDIIPVRNNSNLERISYPSKIKDW